MKVVSCFRAALVAAALSISVGAAVAQRAAESPACREIERRHELAKSEITSTQLNSILFAAADKGCEPLVRTLLAAGASVEARDRLGAMPLSLAARSGYVALVNLLLEKGAAIDARNLAGATALYAAAENDPLWRLPLWMRYDQNIDSKIADVNNVAAGGMAGSIICALFLKRFVSAAKSWLHFDIYAWTPAAKPGRPEGGECQAARAVYALLSKRYGR